MAPCVHMRMGDGSVAILNVSGPTRIIRAGDTDYLFEFHEYLGPTMVGKRGNALQLLPPKRSPFWDALYWWLKQGKRMDGNRCVFEWEMQLVYITYTISRNVVILSGQPMTSKGMQIVAEHRRRKIAEGRR